MQLEDKIGQMLVFGWTGDTAAELETLSARPQILLEELRVGGIILMGRNTHSPEQVRQLTADLQSLAAANGLPPLLICIDQEGGPNTRLVPPRFRASRESWDIGQTGDPLEARREARGIGMELKEIGINWNLAPVLDVNNNPANPVIGRRSFGNDPDAVSEMAMESIRGYQDDAGVMACGKHFPGHGDTAVDSHRDLPVIAHDLEHLLATELKPFTAAVRTGIASIMTSHILFPAIDPSFPATLSRRILTGLLRNRIGFDGIIVTDCMEMRGISVGWDTGDAAVLAAEAGADIILCCHSREPQRSIRNALLAAVRSGRLSESRVDESCARIAKAKARYAVG